MKHAFLIMAHKNKNQLIRLLNRLKSENHFFYVNIDRKAKEFDDNAINEILNTRGVRLVMRDRVNHGGFSMINITLKLMQKAIDDKCDYIHLISGQCYLIVSNKMFDDFFITSSPRSYIYIDGYEEITEFRKNKYRQRICRNWFFDLNQYGTSIEKTFVRVLNKISSFLPQKHINMETIWGGWNWFSFHLELCKFLMQYLYDHPDYIKMFRYSYCGDELFFNSIIMENITKLNVEVHNSLRYVDWNPNRPYVTLPLILNESDYQSIAESGALFCRKVDYPESWTLLQMIDENSL